MAADETEGPAEGPGSGPVPRSAIITFSLVAIGLGIVTLYSLWAFWPSSGASMTPLQQHLSWFGLRLGVNRAFGFAAISMLAELFSPQAFEKLEQLEQLAGHVHVFTDILPESNALIGRQQPGDVSTGVGTAATRGDAPAGDSEP